jgi:hypothetical protein
VVGHAHGLETTLVSVLEHFPDDCEIVVVHSAPYDDPYDLKTELRFIEAPRRTGFVGCANLGIQASRAGIVHLLAAGLEATSGWAEAALARFTDPNVAAVSPVVRNQFDSDEIVAAGISYGGGGRAEIRTELPPQTFPIESSIGVGEPAVYPLARAAFYRRTALNLFGGGLPTTVGNELAAVELGLSLTHAGYQSVLESRCKILGSARSCKESRGFGFGLASERLFWRNLPSTGYLASIAKHPFSVARDLAGSLTNGAALLQVLGRVAAYAALGDCRARHEQLLAAKELAKMRSERCNSTPLPAYVRVDAAHRPTRVARPGDIRIAPH